MNWTLILTTFLSFIFLVPRGLAGVVGLEIGTDSGALRGVEDSLTKRSLKFRADSLSIPIEDTQPFQLKRFLTIHQRRQTEPEPDTGKEPPSRLPDLESLTSTSNPQDKEAFPKTNNQEKSGVGDVVNTVKKKWVKIVEIVVPIAVGIPLLIILLVTCFCCCAACKAKMRERRERKS